MKKPIGIYVHVPFCRSKCPYCDFYSLNSDEPLMDLYTEAVISNLAKYACDIDRKADTLYFGGGTPSLLGSERLVRIIQSARDMFGLGNAEITVECNPSSSPKGLFSPLYEAGVNRLSFGMQSAVDKERKGLGRLAKPGRVAEAIGDAATSGIKNISLDLMIGIPGQTTESLRESIKFCASSGASHVSAYLLKIEEGTEFYKRREELKLPDEDKTCELYLEACQSLETAGFRQYEISNFAVPDMESRHNMKYWDCDEYLGIGPSAHSFIGGKRFYFPRNLMGFVENPAALDDGSGGGFEEYAMLRLRLCDGLRNDLTMERFGYQIPDSLYKNAGNLPKNLIQADKLGIRITPEGFLLSNLVIGGILYG